MEERKYGHVKVKLADIIAEKGVSKGKLCHRAELQRTQLNNYCNNKVARIDLDVVARLCAALDCKVEDIFEYIPPEE